jgi:5-(carboxyamino)imidazole ribonucleotide synthase
MTSDASESQSMPSTPPVVGMIGGGQLARMTHQAAIALGLPLRILAASPTDSAAQVSPHVSLGSPQVPADLTGFAGGCQVLTVDHELVDLDTIELLDRSGVATRPAASALVFATDKAHQRRRFADAGLPLPRHCLTDEAHVVRATAGELGWPVVVKTARGGYDGRGVWICSDAAELDALLAELSSADALPELVVEEHLDLDCELAVIVATAPDGGSIAYPVTETIQVAGICRETIVPARVEPEVAAEATKVALAAARVVGAVGLCAVELFVAGGSVTVNEVATRPHNSGHWTIEGSITSQFENHLRAVAGLPLGDTTPVAPAVVCANVLGHADGRDPLAQLDHALEVPGASVHLYGKGSRPGRKLGHVTVLADSVEDARSRAHRAVAVLGDPVPDRP